MIRLSSFSPVDPLSGRVGLVLIVLVALAADRAYGSQHDVHSRITGVICRGVIEAVTLVGWIADRLPSRQPTLVAASAH
jgi:hypothetical protein